MRHYTGNVPKNELRECQIGGGTRFRGTIPGPVFWLRENPVIDNWENVHVVSATRSLDYTYMHIYDNGIDYVYNKLV